MLGLVICEEGRLLTYPSNDVPFDNLWDAIMLWIAIGFVYHFFMKVVSEGKGKSLLFCRWQISSYERMGCEKTPLCARFARFYRCEKRAARRRKCGAGGSWECPFTCKFVQLHMPPPLPYNRRRKARQPPRQQRERTERTETVVETEAVSAVETTAAPQTSTQQLVTTTHDVQAVRIESEARSQKPTKKKNKKKKRRKQGIPVAWPSTPLIDLARMQHWPQVIARSSVNKIEATYADSDGLLPLHWACSGGPTVEVVVALLEAFPEASGAVDSDGSTPLHFACHYGATVDVVTLLLQSNAGSVQVQDKYGRTPLYHAVYKAANLEVLKALATANPTLITTPCFALATTRSSSRSFKRPLEQTTPLYMAWAAAMRGSQRRRSGKLWEKAQFLLEAAHAQLSSRRIYRMVHASVELDYYLPEQVLTAALELYPEQLKERDEDGRVPLALAAAGRFRSDSRVTQVITLLLRAFPQAAQSADNRGRSPLALATGGGKSWESGVKELFEAAPGQINRPDGVHHLTPPLLSASASKAIVTNTGDEPEQLVRLNGVNAKFLQWMNHVQQMNVRESGKMENEDMGASSGDGSDRQLSTIYELLRLDPTIMKI